MGSADLTLIAALALAALSAYLLTSVLVTNNTDKDVLNWATGQEPEKSKSGIINMFRPLVHNFTLQHAVKIKSETHRKRVEYLIRTGGLSRELNIDEFIGFQILLGVALPIVLSLMNVLMSMEIPWIAIALAVPSGWYYPQIYARAQKTWREGEARRDLPFFADLLALSTQAGLDFAGAMQRIVDKADANSVLADEFSIVLKDIRLGAKRADAIRGLATRIDCQEILSFVAVIVDSDATGVSISQVLKDQSVQIRLERFVRAEKAGAKASQTMLLPMIMFIMPAVILVVLGPAMLSMGSGGK